MNSYKFLIRFLFLYVIYLVNNSDLNAIQEVSLLGVKGTVSSGWKRSKRPSLEQCLEYVDLYLDHLLFKDMFFHRTRMFDKYSLLASRESDSALRGEYKKRAEDSRRKVSELSRKMEENSDFGDELFHLLLTCLAAYGTKFSPQRIYDVNKHRLKYLELANKRAI